MITATRYHDFSAGHRVFGHESKCAHLHGHNYRVHFTITTKQLDDVGRVLDFTAIKDRLCSWLEVNWDHRFLMYMDDPWFNILKLVDPQGIAVVPFNPTAENMAEYLLRVVGPQVLPREVYLVEVIVEETRKCSATAENYEGAHVL